jgi:hypothetical protein
MTPTDYTITTTHGPRAVTLAHAISTGSRARSLSDLRIQAPRGKKGVLIEAIKRVREINPAWPTARHPRLQARLNIHLTRLGCDEIERRSLPTPAGWDEISVSTIDRRPRIWLVRGEGFYKYSRRAGTWHVQGSYLCGIDNGHPWAVRVPGTIDTVYAAEEWLLPAPVRSSSGPVLRQGDIYFVPSSRENLSALDHTRHAAKPRKAGGYSILHPEHRAIVLSGKYRWRAYQQRQLSSGNTRANGD